MHRKPQMRGRWLLDWGARVISFPTIAQASGFYLDVRRLNSASDALDVIGKARSQEFVTPRDILDLCDLLRIVVRERF